MRRWTGLLLCVVLSGAMVLSPAAAQTDAVKALKKLFDTDPARAFVHAVRMFEGPAAEGDLEGMLDIIRVVAPNAVRCQYGAVLEDMIDAAVPVAERSGKWRDLGDLYAARADMVFAYGWGAGTLRLIHFGDLAEQAYEKVGGPPPSFGQLRSTRDRAKKREVPVGINSGFVRPDVGSRSRALDEALAEARDGYALSLMQDLLRDASTERDMRYWGAAVGFIGLRLWVRGAERMLPELRSAVNIRHGLPGIHHREVERIARGCTRAWTGRDDAFRETYYWCQRHLDVGEPWSGYSWLAFGRKVRLFGREAEALDLTRRWIALNDIARPEYRQGTGNSAELVWPGVPPDIRRALVSLECDGRLRGAEKGESRCTIEDLIGRLRQRVIAKAPAEQKARWALETGFQLLDAAVRFPQPASRAQGATAAAELLDVGGRPDLADHARALADALTEGDPKALVQCALASARSAAAAGRWEAMVSALEPVLAGQGASADLLQAHLLLGQASRELGKPEEAEAWLTRALGLVNQLGPSAAGRANHIMNIASLTQDQRQRVALLEQAERAAGGAGLDLVTEKIADQLAEASLEVGDLAAAEHALLQIIDRHEQKRHRLAFDPVLRQQWFADNITPYRQLLRVAAVKNDPYLALSCAERMRSRVLMDQLSWRKVDMGVRLPRQIRERLERVREMRQQAYALLNTVVGGGGGASVADGRGMYMPIRGMYMPIRGPLDEGRQATEADVARLKELLASLAEDEAALESAIRESVPAYAMASNVRIPSGRELADVIGKRPELAVLEYTFSDRGLVVVGMRGGKSPKVVMIPQQQTEALWEQIGKFRQQIWQRKDEATKHAAELYQVLLAPVEDMLAGAQRLWVIAEGALQLVPFAALLDGENRYLGQRMAVAYAPSLSLALTSRGRRPSAELAAVIVAAPDTGVVGVGDAERGMYMPIRGMYMPIRGMYMPIRGEGGASSALTAMAMVPLPGARAEGEALAQQFEGSLLLSGKDATKARLLAEGGKCDVLHLATHGYADPDVPEFSVLLLAGRDEQQPYEVLTALEVYSWPLRARLVTLSACQTALGKDVEGEGVLGLTRAFIHAGAQNVLCSLWPVSDESTRRLMTAFYESLQNGATVEQALREAQSLLLDAEDTRHPFYWAGFVAVRGPG